MYDQTGSADSAQFEGFDAEDIFSQFQGFRGNPGAGGGMGFEDLFGDLFGTGGKQRGRQKASDTKENIMATI